MTATPPASASRSPGSGERTATGQPAAGLRVSTVRVAGSLGSVHPLRSPHHRPLGSAQPGMRLLPEHRPPRHPPGRPASRTGPSRPHASSHLSRREAGGKSARGPIARASAGSAQRAATASAPSVILATSRGPPGAGGARAQGENARGTDAAPPPSPARSGTPPSPLNHARSGRKENTVCGETVACSTPAARDRACLSRPSRRA